MEKDTKTIIFLSILLVVQIGCLVYLLYTKNSVDLDTYCREHGYSHGTDISVVGGGYYED